MRCIVAPPTLSIQLYTVREEAAENLNATLQRLADIGFTRVEPYAFSQFPGLRGALQASGLAAPTAHQRFIGASDAELDALFAEASALGIGTVIDPKVDESKWADADGIRATAAALNAASKIAGKHGLVVGYHNHAHEIELREDGMTALEFLAANLDEEVVLEVDTYWVVVGGADPLAVLKNLGDRVVAVHIKDGPGTAETKDQVAVGQGSLPIADLIAATPNALHVVELDDSRGDRFQAVEDSFRYLSALKIEVEQ